MSKTNSYYVFFLKQNIFKCGQSIHHYNTFLDFDLYPHHFCIDTSSLESLPEFL